MYKAFIVAAGVALVAAAGMSLTGNSYASDQAEAVQALIRKIDALGYDVRRLKIDDGVFKVLIIDRQSGGAVKARFDMASGELVRARLP